MRWLITSRWARRLAASLVAGSLAAGLVALGAEHWEARRLFGSAETAWQAGDYRTAADLFAKLVERHPGHRLAPEALLRVGRARYLFLKDTGEAVRALRQLARREDAGPRAREAQRLLGEIFEVRQGDCRQAIVEYQRMIGLDPRGAGNDEAQLAVARCSFALGEYEQSRAEHELLLERYPESPLRPRALLGIANTWYVTGRFDQAVKFYREAGEATEDPVLAAEAGFGVATALEEAGDLAGALAEFERVRTGYPNPGLVAQRVARVRARIVQQGGRTAPGPTGRE